MNKKAMVLLTTCIIGLVVVFVADVVVAPNALHQDAVPVQEIIRDPSSWVGRTVTVEGILESVPMPNPTLYGLRPEDQNEFLSVQWNSSDMLIPQYNATTAIVRGTIIEEEWTPPNLIPSHAMEVYYIEAESVEFP